VAAALAGAALLAGGLVAAPAQAAPDGRADRPLPGTIHRDLPAGFQPEGIAIDERGRYAYLGSRVDGDVARLDLRNGAVGVLSQGPGTPSLGMKVDDRDRLFVAGGAGGDARVVDTRTGAVLRSYQLVPDGTAAFINDVVLTDDAAYLTDSAAAQLFVLPLGRRGGLPRADAVVRIPLSGSWTQGTSTSANGITETPDGRALLVVNSSNGTLYRVNKTTGRSVIVDLGGATLPNGDGMLLEGRQLVVVQNRLDTLAFLRVSEDGREARVKRTLTDPDLDVPTTVARAQRRLYVPNARFSTPPTPATPYWVTGLGVAVPRSAQR
jgi:sugar lactone lactonase YvrE